MAIDKGDYSRTFDIDDLRSAYRVEAYGNILGACSIFSWRKELTVLQVGRRFRVLLSGTEDTGKVAIVPGCGSGGGS